MLATGGDDVDGVAPDAVSNVDPADGGDQFGDLEVVGDWLELVEWRTGAVAVDHLELGIHRRVSDGDPGGEAVALSLRKGIGAFHLDRVLRRDHHERRVEGVGAPVDGDLALLHALKKRRLSL